MYDSGPVQRLMILHVLCVAPGNSIIKGLDTPKTAAFFHVGKRLSLKEKHGGSCRFYKASSVNGKTSNKSMTKTTRWCLVCLGLMV